MTTTETVIAPNVKHPAKYSQSILDAMAPLLRDETRRLGREPIVCDPMCGVGRVHDLPGRTVGGEIEPEWAACRRPSYVGDALYLPFADGSIDVVVVSPVYSNRLSDHHDAQERCRACKATGEVDGEACPRCKGAGRNRWKRRSYTFDLGRPLHPNNAGTLAWGQAYATFHEAAWAEVARVVRPGGLFLLNVSDFVSRGKTVEAASWHKRAAVYAGFKATYRVVVPTPRLRFGANREARADGEVIWVLRREVS